MALEMSKNVKAFDDQEVTSQQRDPSGGAEAGGQDQAQQSSILSLTLEELQNSLCEQGRNVGSMNMDEFMTNVWNAEELQAATGRLLQEAGEAGVMGVAGGGGAGEGDLFRQGSFSMPPPLCRKTVDEVWAEINQEPMPAPAPAQASPRPHVHPHPQLGGGGVEASDRQATLGDMTLEDFLVKAGVVRGSSADQAPMPVALVRGPMNPMPVRQQHQGHPGAMMYPVAPANAMYPMMGDGMGFPGGYHGGMAVVLPAPPSQGAAAEVSPGSSDGLSAMTQTDMMNYAGNGPMIENAALKRRAPEDWPVEKSVERRHRRMIKNRESAARSRARKQAYTVELETELDHLKQENARLKAEEKTILSAKKQMLVEKMMEQAKANVDANKGGRSRRSGSCMW